MVLKLNLEAVHLKQVQKKEAERAPKQAEAKAPVDGVSQAVNSNPLAALLGKSTPSQTRTPASNIPSPTPKVPEKPKVVVADDHVLQPPPVVSAFTEQESKEMVKTILVEGEPIEDLVVDFKKRLEDLNRLVEVDTQLSPFAIDQAKGYVRQIMIDLNQHSELDACVIDRDVHNIVAFIRSVKSMAVDSQTVVKAKRVAKEKKAKITDGFVLSLPAPGEAFKLDLKTLAKTKT